MTGSLQGLDKAVFVQGDDIVVRLRYAGTWFEDMQVNNFPFDTQALAFSFAVNVRTTGMTPVELVVSDTLTVNYPCQSAIRPYQQWQLLQNCHTCAPGLWGSGDRQFPTMDFAIYFRRRAAPVLTTVFLPSLFYPLLTAAMYVVQPPSWEAAYYRASIPGTMLLVVVTFKQTVSWRTPRVPYLTYVTPDASNPAADQPKGTCRLRTCAPPCVAFTRTHVVASATCRPGRNCFC